MAMPRSAASTRASWGPLGETLRQRQSLCGLLLVVDSRRGVSDLDLGLLDWADLPEEAVHVLLSKADKLTRGPAQAVLREARVALAGRASCQLFSAQKGEGLDEARAVLKRLSVRNTQDPQGK